jgi:ribose transport system substrate-binding protein
MFSKNSIIILAVIAAIPGCNSSKSSTSVPSGSRPAVAFVTNNPATFWNIVEAGGNKAALENNVELVFKRPSSGNAAEQKEIIDSLVGQKIKAISISVIDPNNQSADLDKVAAKVPLLAVDNDAPRSKRHCYIGTDNYSAGRQAGKLVKEALPDGGVISVFVGQTEALNARQRCQGVLDELADAPPLTDPNNVPTLPTGSQQYGKYKLHKIATDQPEGESVCKQKATDALIELEKEPNVCLIGLWAYNPPAILAAVKDQKRLGKVKIVGFDEDPATLDGIDDGNIVGTIVQDPFNFGYESVKVMANLAKGGKDDGPAVRYVPTRVITKAGGKGKLTVQEYSAQEQAKKGKSVR